MSFFRSIFRFKDKHPYVKIEKKIEVLAPFLIGRKIDNIYLNDFYESNLKEYDIFKLGNNFVLYFDKSMDAQTDLYIRENFFVIRERLKSKGRDFVYFPILLENLNLEILPTLKSTFPASSDAFTALILDYLQDISFNIDNCYDEFLEFINYTGGINKGCISGNSGFTILEQNEHESIEDFIDGYIDNLPINEKDLLLYSINKEEYQKNISNVKKESLETLQNIKEQIEILRENGQLAILAPKIYKLLKNSIEGIVYNKTEPILVTEDFKILIPNYNNIEIKLSFLTKSIYLLFLSHPEPIQIKELHLHRDRLLLIYRQVSNLNSYDRIKEAIDDLLKEDNEAIYVHFSRIKKAFLTHFSENTAYRYYISGEKGRPKKIIFDRKEVVFKCNLS